MEAIWSGPPPEAITAWLLVQAGHQIGRRFHHALGQLGLTPTQFGVLLELDLHPGLGNAEIARAILVTPQSMSDLVGGLVDLGYVTRETAPGRGYRVAATLTATGREVLGRCQSAVDTVQASLGLNNTDATQLNVLLGRVLREGAVPEQSR